MKSAEVIGWALGGIEREISSTRERLSSLTAQANALRARLGRKGTTTAQASETAAVGDTGGARKRRRRAMSAEARKRISDNMKKRWADRKKKGQNKL